MVEKKSYKREKKKEENRDKTKEKEIISGQQGCF